MCIKLCFSSLQYHAAEVVPLGHPHLNLQGDQNKHVEQAKHVPPSYRRDYSLPSFLHTSTFGALYSNLRTAVLDKLGGLTQ